MSKQIKSPVLKLSNQRMLVFMKYCIENNVAGCDGESDFTARIGLTGPNLRQIKIGADRNFTVDQISKACEVFGLDANFIHRQSHTKMFPAEPTKSALAELKELTVRLGLELKGK